MRQEEQIPGMASVVIKGGRSWEAEDKPGVSVCSCLFVIAVDCHKEKGEAMEYNTYIIQTELDTRGISWDRMMQNKVTMLSQLKKMI